MTSNNINEQIVKYSKELRLPTFRHEFKQQAIEAAKQQLGYEIFLLHLMEKEYETRLEIFGDAVLTAALVDRLTHKAYLVNMNGESYRLKETREMNQK